MWAYIHFTGFQNTKGRIIAEPKIYKLGSGAWQKLKQNTKKRVKDIAKDLIQLYAERMSSPGYSFSPDSYLQRELEASFIYEDTPDQLNAALAVKNDMETIIRWTGWCAEMLVSARPKLQ